MGYALEYDLQTIKVKKKIKERSNKLQYAAVTVGLILCVAAMHLGGSVFQTIILGEREDAKAAAEQMVANIKEGTSLNEAIQTFCLELAQ